MAWVVLGVDQMSLNPAPPTVNEFKGTNTPTTRGYVGSWFMVTNNHTVSINKSTVDSSREDVRQKQREESVQNGPDFPSSHQSWFLPFQAKREHIPFTWLLSEEGSLVGFFDVSAPWEPCICQRWYLEMYINIGVQCSIVLKRGCPLIQGPNWQTWHWKMRQFIQVWWGKDHAQRRRDSI